MKLMKHITITATIAGFAVACGSDVSEDTADISDTAFTQESAQEVTNVDSGQVDEVVVSMNNGSLTGAYQTALAGSSGFRFRDMEGKFESANCPKVTTSGTNPITIERVFDNCTPGKRLSKGNAISINGKTTVVITKGAGDNPSADPKAFDRQIQAVRDLTIGGVFRSSLKVNSDNSTSIVGDTGSKLSINRTIKSKRVRSNAKGEEVREYEIEGSRAIEISFANGDISEFKLVSGDTTINEVFKGKLGQGEQERKMVVKASNVVWNSSCCHPVSGTREMTLTNRKGEVSTHTFEYSSTCGEALLDGSKIQLNQCESF